ncbi:hypothetical protein DU500_11155 [Haloplanus rubicundus]|uniref:Halobacterial output domain-containing protein n=2 Tax=Haloplanus rubicundus TaxID=1547898 RepID=A0A345E416_9EURY|nr:hypothetical protein DU500_11155 [Haloplanus rubicundus]
MERTVEADKSVSYTLLCTVAEVESCRPTDLPVLQDTLDVDALDAMFASKSDESPRFEGSLTFEYSDSIVSIRSTPSVTISVSS